MKRRGMGMGYVSKKQEVDKSIAAFGQEFDAQRVEAVKEKLSTLKDKLHEFAQVHGEKIRKDPVFRYKFHQMCTNMGVDPLASSKGFWAKTLGIGDFYYELAIKATEICLVTRPVNGGLIEVNELTERLKSKLPESKRSTISTEDIICGIRKLEVLNAGFKIVSLGVNKVRFVQSVPKELSTDGLGVISYISEKIAGVTPPEGHLLPASTTPSELETHLNWTAIRATRALTELLDQGMLWKDFADGSYWAPSVLSF
eukprot:TRINITY_DN25319_c0_g1_i1.p1 TRINITY_DN25319_c0_g1~~TRINITY_DN25319_c0_g1_i1.p1  ORF type:complete len:284 (+),score=49.74 TRINITY_DN25319_c0_g1_i1:86-853(+)